MSHYAYDLLFHIKAWLGLDPHRCNSEDWHEREFEDALRKIIREEIANDRRDRKGTE
jgi:hypothetical protein